MGKSFFERLFSPFFLLAIHLHPVEDGEFSLFYMLKTFRITSRLSSALSSQRRRISLSVSSIPKSSPSIIKIKVPPCPCVSVQLDAQQQSSDSRGITNHGRGYRIIHTVVHIKQHGIFFTNAASSHICFICDNQCRRGQQHSSCRRAPSKKAHHLRW